MTTVKSIALLGTVAAMAGAAYPQNTSGVFSPVVREGDLSAQYRLGFDPDDDTWTQRFHAQRALDTTVRLRGIVQLERDPGEDADLDYVQAELLWQLTPDGNAYQTAFRFDARVRPADEPELFRAIWTNDYKLTDRLSVRGIVVTGAEFGDAAFDGVSLETRARLAYALDAGPQVSLQLFSTYGTTEDIANLEDQQHLLGPDASIDLGETWSMVAGVLFGLTDASPDTNLRLWIGRPF